MLHARGEGHLLVGTVEVPVLLAQLGLAHELDVPRVADAQTLLVSDPDEVDAERVEAHELGGDRVDGDLIGAREQHVLHVGDHATRSRSVAGEGAVHDREETGMDLLLDHEQVHERFVDDGVGSSGASR